MSKDPFKTSFEYKLWLIFIPIYSLFIGGFMLIASLPILSSVVGYFQAKASYKKRMMGWTPLDAVGEGPLTSWIIKTFTRLLLRLMAKQDNNESSDDKDQPK
jgi:hypothetical protein